MKIESKKEKKIWSIDCWWWADWPTFDEDDDDDDESVYVLTRLIYYMKKIQWNLWYFVHKTHDAQTLDSFSSWFDRYPFKSILGSLASRLVRIIIFHSDLCIYVFVCIKKNCNLIYRKIFFSFTSWSLPKVQSSSILFFWKIFVIGDLFIAKFMKFNNMNKKTSFFQDIWFDLHHHLCVCVFECYNYLSNIISSMVYLHTHTRTQRYLDDKNVHWHFFHHDDCDW